MTITTSDVTHSHGSRHKRTKRALPFTAQPSASSSPAPRYDLAYNARLEQLNREVESDEQRAERAQRHATDWRESAAEARYAEERVEERRGQRQG